MAKNFIYGVMNAEFRKNNQVLLTAKTSVDTSLSFTTESTEIRAGSGNMLLAKIYHSAGLALNFTDVCFKMQYLALNLGTKITLGANCYTTESVVLTENGKGAIQGNIEMIDNQYLGFVHFLGDDYKYTVEVNPTTKEFTVPGGREGDKVCIEYSHYNDAAKEIKVPAEYVPAIVEVVGWIDLYTGESKESATKVGKVELVIPNFQLSGAMELSLTANGQCNVPLSGNALAANDEADCSGDSAGCYAYIREYKNNGNWYDTLQNLIVSGGSIEISVGDVETLKVIGVHSEGIENTECTNSKLTFASSDETKVVVDETGKITGVDAGTTSVTITCTGKTKISTTVDVTVTA